MGRSLKAVCAIDIMASQLVGLGCTLKTIGGRIVITEVKAGGGAAVSGNVKPYDVLASVNGVRLSSVEHAKTLLLGAPGTSLIAGLERCGVPVNVTIWRGGIATSNKAERKASSSGSLPDRAPVAAQPGNLDAQPPNGSSFQGRLPVARPLPSIDQIRSFSAAALFDECCCPPRQGQDVAQKLDMFNSLATRAQCLALHICSERSSQRSKDMPQPSQELRAISASCAKIQVTLDGIEVSGADRDFRKSIIKLCEAVASQCDEALA